MATYKVVLPEPSTWSMNPDGTKGPQLTKWECDHKHRTYSGARRCLDKLSVYYPDGCHNEFAHFGTVWVVGADGWTRPVEWEILDQYYDQYQERYPDAVIPEPVR